MNTFKNIFLFLLLFIISIPTFAQCPDGLAVNSSSAECNGDGTSTVTINISITWGNGNNSAALTYNLGGEDVQAIVIEDNDGDINNQTYTFIVPTCDNYTVALTGWTNPAASGSSCPGNIINTSIILPVTFGQFEVKRNNRNINIDWSTLSEINNDKFIIQRASENTKFENVGEVISAGNSFRQMNYNFVDKDLRSGMNYYRIQQIDLDGNFSYSETRQIKVELISDILVYPNPSKNNIVLSSASYGMYRIFDAHGKIIKSINTEQTSNDIDISEFESGLYFIVGDQNKNTTSFIKL